MDIKLDIEFNFVQSVTVKDRTIISGAKQLPKMDKIELIFNLLNALPNEEITTLMIIDKLKEYDRKRIITKEKANRTSQNRIGRINRTAKTVIETIKNRLWPGFIRGCRKVLEEVRKRGNGIKTRIGNTYRQIAG